MKVENRFYGLSRGLMYLGVAMLMLGPMVSIYFYSMRPTVAEPDRERLYPVEIKHGMVVYVTSTENKFYNLALSGGVRISGLFFVFLSISLLAGKRGIIRE